MSGVQALIARARLPASEALHVADIDARAPGRYAPRWINALVQLIRHTDSGRRMYLAWEHGGEDPWTYWHDLDGQGRPRGLPDAELVLPQFPARQHGVRMALALVKHTGGLNPPKK